MAYLNQVNLIGNVGNDPEIRYIDNNPQNPSGSFKLATFKVATTERYKDRNGEQREQTQWHLCVANGTIADVVEKYLKKGASVYIGGKLTYREWTDQSGNKRYSTEVRVFTIQMLDRKLQASGTGYQYTPQTNPDSPENHPEDLPF